VSLKFFTDGGVFPIRLQQDKKLSCHMGWLF